MQKHHGYVTLSATFERLESSHSTASSWAGHFLLFSDSPEQLHEMHRQIREFLYRFRLTLHPGKSRVYRCRDGFPFLGLRLLPTHARLARPNVVRFRRRLRRLHADYHAGLIDQETVNQSVQAWIGHAMHGDTWRLREQIFEAFPFLAAHRPTR